jgi:uncharacterized protein (DUF305 family)
MNTTAKILISAVIGILVGAGGVMAFSKNDNERVADNKTSGHLMPGGEVMGGQGMNMQDEMTSMNADLKGKTGDAFDQAFLSEMTVHHQGAVEMAQSALANAKHKEIKDLANGIITAQQKEIAEMKAWQKMWYGTASTSASVHMSN